MKVDENYLDKYGRSCLVFSGVKKFSDVYDFMDELHDEVALEAGYIRKDKETYVRR